MSETSFRTTCPRFALAGLAAALGCHGGGSPAPGSTVPWHDSDLASLVDSGGDADTDCDADADAETPTSNGFGVPTVIFTTLDYVDPTYTAGVEVTDFALAPQSDSAPTACEPPEGTVAISVDGEIACDAPALTCALGSVAAGPHHLEAELRWPDGSELSPPVHFLAIVDLE